MFGIGYSFFIRRWTFDVRCSTFIFQCNLWTFTKQFSAYGVRGHSVFSQKSILPVDTVSFPWEILNMALHVIWCLFKFTVIDICSFGWIKPRNLIRPVVVGTSCRLRTLMANERTAAICMMPGSIGWSGKWPWKHGKSGWKTNVPFTDISSPLSTVYSVKDSNKAFSMESVLSFFIYWRSWNVQIENLAFMLLFHLFQISNFQFQVSSRY